MVWKEPELGPDPTPPLKKPGEKGTRGRSISLYTNHFPVTFKNMKLVIYHYDVAIKDHTGSEDIPKTWKQKIFEKLKESFPKVFGSAIIAFDNQKNAYSATNIPQLKKAVTYSVEMRKDSGSKSKYNVRMVKVNQAKLSDVFSAMKDHTQRFKSDKATIFQMIEIMFRHYRALKYIPIGRNSFYPDDFDEFRNRTNIGGGKDGVTGFFASLRPAAWKDGSILLNLDMTQTAFYREQSVIEFIKETLHMRDNDFNKPLQLRDRKDLLKDLKGLKVKTTHTPLRRSYKVNGITIEGANRLKFEIDTDGIKKKVSVCEYLNKQYKYKLKYPELNCLHVGNLQKNIYIPIEVCHIEKGQRVKKKLSDQEISQFIRSTAVPPADRLLSIKAAAQKNNFKDDKMLNSLSFSVEDMPMNINGRVINPPNLAMDDSRTKFLPRDGVWDVRGKKFQKPSALTHWAVLNYDGMTQLNDVQKFITTLMNIGKELGMNINKPFDIYASQNPNPDQDLKYYKEKNKDLQLVMCVISGRKIYPTIKKAGDRDNELITQCVMGMNVKKCQSQTIQNLLMKINAKLGGTNTAFVLGNPMMEFVNSKQICMIMGADVNHPPAGNTTMPSLVAVVGSYDRFATKYAAEVRAQMHRVEVIEDMTEITINLLRNFYTKAKLKPQRIIMYRDGVSESQFSEVLGAEMRKMRAACTQLSKEYTPGITFICVQKRHHTRLFCANQREGVGRAGNVPPGTVVDTDIVHPIEKDFYLCSHQGIQGTSRPAHYHVLWDDNDFTMDQLQTITYELCHMYSRCTRSVSIPCPAYYAHLAAFRAKVYVTEILNEDGQSSTGSSGDTKIDEHAVKKITRVAVDMKLGGELYYV